MTKETNGLHVQPPVEQRASNGSTALGQVPLKLAEFKRRDMLESPKDPYTTYVKIEGMNNG